MCGLDVRVVAPGDRVKTDRRDAKVPQTSHAATVARLRCFRGIDTLTAAGLCAEVDDFHRFAKPHCSQGSSAWCRASTPLMKSALRGRSPRPALTSTHEGPHVAAQRAREHRLWATRGFTRRVAPDLRLRARRRTKVLR
jgi:hypothetical protein